jgi:hypothetical protein
LTQKYCIYFRYWKRPLTLAQLLEELEKDDVVDFPEQILIFPPENANDDCDTDEDSGDEDLVVPDNLPGAQLSAEVEVQSSENNSQDWDSDDNKPLSTFVERRPKVLKNFEYESSDLEITTFSDWKDVSSVQNNLSPAATFKLFFDQEVINLVLYFSNIFAQQKNRAGDIAADELLCFIGVLLLSGYVPLPRKKMFWQNRDDTNNKLVCEAISRDRFQYIMSNLHCNDNTKLNKADKYSKLRPLFDILNKKFFEYAPAEENHSIDESMIPYFGRHSGKQFIRGKPIRWGYKFWIGALRLGYIVYFDPYQGSSTTLPEKYKHMGLGASVVLQYADILDTMHYDFFHLYFDNFFTSISLLKELKLRNIKATGTLRENRLPHSPLSKAATLKKKERGVFEYVLADKEVVVAKWNDNSVVSVASNAHQIFPVNKVKRFSQSEKKHIYIDQPRLIKSYNENMGGVDRGDQNLSEYRVSIRGKKWYFPLFAHCVDMAMQNAWRLHKSNRGKLDLLEFRRSVATELLESHKRTTKRGPSKSSKNLHEFSRYDRLDHLVTYQQNQRRCAVCHKKANFVCHKCDVGLHPKDCFVNYQTI